MDDGGAELSARARMRAAARERRGDRARLDAAVLDLVVSGFAIETIADKLQLSLKAVRRTIARAVERRRLDDGAQYVQLQVMRLTKALRVVDHNLDRGDLKAVEPLLKLIAQLDKYHAPAPLPAPVPAPPSLAPPPPPLALGPPREIPIGTENGAQAAESPPGETRMRVS